MNAVTLGRILIVDDEAANMRALCDTLRDKGYETEGASSGEEALRALGAQPFDLLLTDLMMPGMDGIALLTAALKVDPQLVGILMTGQGTVETAVSAMQAGALDYVLKPIKLGAILPVLARALVVSRLRQDNVELRNSVALHELNQAIAHTLDPNVLLEKIADAMLGQFDADEASVMLVSQDGQSLQIAAVRGAGREALLGTRVPIGQGIAGRVALLRESVVLGDTIADAGLAPSYPRADIRSALSMPMITRGKVVGVINVNSLRRTRAFALGQVKVLSIFTNTAAAAIESARLNREQRLSDYRFRQLVANVKDYAIVMLDPMGRVASWNEGARIMYGHQDSQILGRPMAIFYSQEDAQAQRPAQILERATLTGRAEDEGWRVRQDGSGFQAYVVLNAMHDETGKLEGFSKITRDVTESRAAQRAVTMERAFLRKVIDTDPNLIFAKDGDGRFVLANKATADAYGTTTENLIGKTDRDFNPDLDQVEHFMRHDKVVLESHEEIFIPEEKLTDAAGRHRWLQTVKRAITGRDGLSDMVLGVSTDITRRKVAEQKLVVQMRRAEALLEAAPDPVVIVDSAGRVAMVNARAVQMFGYSRSEMIGQPAELLIPERRHEAYARKRIGYMQMLTACSMGTDRDVFARCKDGSEIAVDVSLSPLVMEDETFVIGTVRDVSERKRAELEIRELNASLEQRVADRTLQLQEADHAKDSFLATMSHEIRTPLGGLLGMLELLSLSPLTEEQTDTLRAARNSGRSLLRILNDILDWSKIEDGKLELAPHPASVARLVADVANTYAHVASGNSITLVTSVDPRLSAAFTVDALRLSQVLNNFVSNAIKFSHRGGRVTLAAEWRGTSDRVEEVRFSVSDTGIGIDPQVQLRLFESYGQASADTARMYGGTGLGLAICRRLADLLGGRIELDSVPGRGSTFSITLMLIPTELELSDSEDSVDIHLEPMAGSARTSEAPMILVVDDHDINRKLLARQLALLGSRVEIANDGELALPMWQRGKFDLVITDCHMPKMDGYELTCAIRKIEADEARGRTPIFAWTANALADEADRCYAAGMDELLVKPAEIAQLQRLLRKWLPDGTRAEPEPVASPSTQEAGVAVVDIRVLEGLVGDDPEVIRDFLGEFRDAATKIVAEIRAAWTAGNRKEVGDSAHKLKSSARSVGALALGEYCAKIESAVLAGQDAVLAAMVQQLEQELVAVQSHLDVLLSSDSKDS